MDIRCWFEQTYKEASLNPSSEVLTAGHTAVPQSSDWLQSLNEGEPAPGSKLGSHTAVRDSPEWYTDPSEGLDHTVSFVVCAIARPAARRMQQ